MDEGEETSRRWQGMLEGKAEKRREGRNKREERENEEKEGWKEEKEVGEGQEMRGSRGKEREGRGEQAVCCMGASLSSRGSNFINSTSPSK